MLEIIEYDEKYKEKIIDLWLEICVKEFGFKEWENGIKNMENHSYGNNNGKFLIAVENEEVIGTISLKNIGNPKGMLKGFYVRNDYRAKKLGLKLMNEIIDSAIKMGYKELVLDTYEAFTSAIRFYEKYGFEKIDQIEDKLIMKITL